jgi:hypothetical protein
MSEKIPYTSLASHFRKLLDTQPEIRVARYGQWGLMPEESDFYHLADFQTHGHLGGLRDAWPWDMVPLGSLEDALGRLKVDGKVYRELIVLARPLAQRDTSESYWTILVGRDPRLRRP